MVLDDGLPKPDFLDLKSLADIQYKCSPNECEQLEWVEQTLTRANEKWWTERLGEGIPQDHQLDCSEAIGNSCDVASWA